MSETDTISLLGLSGVGPDDLERIRLEWFPAPKSVSKVSLRSDEMMSFCPITKQPDWYSIEIAYTPDKRCVESKSLKLYLQSFIYREGQFGEGLAAQIADDFLEAIDPILVEVFLHQKPRGGISIETKAIRIRTIDQGLQSPKKDSYASEAKS